MALSMSSILDVDLEELVDITLDGELVELVDIILDGELEELVDNKRCRLRAKSLSKLACAVAHG